MRCHSVDIAQSNIDVWVFGVIAIAVVIYYSFVYMRACKLKAEIAKEKKRLELAAGKSVR